MLYVPVFLGCVCVFVIKKQKHASCCNKKNDYYRAKVSEYVKSV